MCNLTLFCCFFWKVFNPIIFFWYCSWVMIKVISLSLITFIRFLSETLHFLLINFNLSSFFNSHIFVIFIGDSMWFFIKVIFFRFFLLCFLWELWRCFLLCFLRWDCSEDPLEFTFESVWTKSLSACFLCFSISSTVF